MSEYIWRRITDTWNVSYSKHVLQKVLFAEDANYLIICGSKVMDVLSIIGVVVVFLLR
jgi:hypothetical protein